MFPEIMLPYLEANRLRRVTDAPEFAYSAHLVYSNQTEPALIEKFWLGRRSLNPA